MIDCTVSCVLQTIREEAKTTSKFYIAQLIKVDKQTTKNRTRRDERMSAAAREHARTRIEFIRERERRATTDIGSSITTERIPELEVTSLLDVITYGNHYSVFQTRRMATANKTCVSGKN